MKIESATIVLVGNCNADPLSQHLIGTIVFRRDEGGGLEPRLVKVSLGEKSGTQSNPYKPKFVAKGKGSYSITFPEGDVGIRLNREKNQYDFSTGLHHYDLGTSGPISNGGPELTDALDSILNLNSPS